MRRSVGGIIAAGLVWSSLAVGAEASPDGQEIRFPSADPTVTLTGRLFTPAQATTPGPAVVLLHGCGGLFTRDGALTTRHRDWAERFVSWGHTVIAPDSFAPRGLGPQCAVRERDWRVERDRVADAYGALAAVQKLASVDPARVVLMGWSNGAQTVLAALATDPEGRPANLTGPDFVQGFAFYPGCGGALRRWPHYRPRAPLTVLSGALDDWTPAAPCAKLHAAAQGGFTFQILPDAYHDFDNPNGSVVFRPEIKNGVHAGRHEPARQTAIDLVAATLGVARR